MNGLKVILYRLAVTQVVLVATVAFLMFAACAIESTPTPTPKVMPTLVPIATPTPKPESTEGHGWTA